MSASIPLWWDANQMQFFYSLARITVCGRVALCREVSATNFLFLKRIFLAISKIGYQNIQRYVKTIE